MSEISKIKLTDFESHSVSELDFSKVNILIGENGSGKSSVVNAITLGLSGNLPTKPYSDYVKTGAEQGAVELNVKIGENTRQTRKVLSQDGKVKTELLSTNQLLQQMGTNPETARTLSDTWYFVESATDAARRNVLSSVLSKEYSAEELQVAIANKSSAETLPWHQNFIATNYADLVHPKKTQLEVLYKIAFDQRAAVKKEITSLEAQIADTNSKLSAYAEIPQEVDPDAVKRTIDHTNLSRNLEFMKQNMQSEKTNLDEYIKKIESLKQTKVQIEGSITTQVDSDEVNTLQSNKSVLGSQVAGLRGQIKKLEEISGGDMTCPIYGVHCDLDPVTSKAKLEEDLADKEKNLESTTTLLKEKSEQLDLHRKIAEIETLLQGADAKVSEKNNELQSKQEKLDAMQLEITELEGAGILTKEGLDASKNQTEVTNLKARKTVYEEDLTKRKSSLAQFEEAVALYKDKEIWTSLLSCNKDIFINKLKEVVELLIPKYTVAIDDSMNLSFDQVSINTLSKSEKFRVGVGIQTALSIASKIGIVIVDGSDIVTDPTNLIETINKLGMLPEIETLIVTSSYDFTQKDTKRETKIEVPATHYIIKDGNVERKPDLFGTESW